MFKMDYRPFSDSIEHATSPRTTLTCGKASRLCVLFGFIIILWWTRYAWGPFSGNLTVPPRQEFAPGARLSILDIAVILLSAGAAVFIARWDFWFGIAIAFVVGHFFLFCNLLRMSRMPELIWAAVFGVLAILASTAEVRSWPLVFLFSVICTMVLAVFELRKPSYHGIGWQSINPQLPEWWNEFQRNREDSTSVT